MGLGLISLSLSPKAMLNMSVHLFMFLIKHDQLKRCCKCVAHLLYPPSKYSPFYL